jgi:hypothetical protein
VKTPVQDGCIHGFFISIGADRLLPDDGQAIMIFVYEGKEYAGATAIEIARKMDEDGNLCSAQHFSVRIFVSNSLARLADRIHLRELDASAHLSNESLAFSYLCLLDEYGIGQLHVRHDSNT